MRTHVTILNVQGSDSAGEVIPYLYFLWKSVIVFRWFLNPMQEFWFPIYQMSWPYCLYNCSVFIREFVLLFNVRFHFASMFMLW